MLPQPVDNLNAADIGTASRTRGHLPSTSWSHVGAALPGALGKAMAADVQPERETLRRLSVTAR